MANLGGGNFYFIDSPMLIPQIFVQELKDLSSVTARDVEIIIEIPHQVDAHVMGGWKQTQEENKLRISIGDLVSNQEREVYLKMLFPPQNQDPNIVIHAKVIGKDESGQIQEDQGSMDFRYAEKDTIQNMPLQQDVMQRFSIVEVADVANEALKLERKGEFEKAGKLLDNVLSISAPYMAAEKLEQYQGLSRRMIHGLREMDRKTSHLAQYMDKQRRNR
jgi:Ca-activated chloride channel family protein